MGVATVHQKGIPPEADLLVAASRTTLDPESHARIRSLVTAGVDWHRLIHLARVHGTRPLLYRSLSAVCADLLPPDFQRTLRAHYCASVLQNARSVSALVEIMGALQDRAIQALPLKGPTLAKLAYGDVMLREFGDLDFLVRKPDLERSSEVLRGLGFAFIRNQDQSERGYHALYRKSDGVSVDIQWMMAGNFFSFSLEHSILQDRTSPVELAGAEIRGLTPEALLLVLCIHGSKHAWSQLKWICDVAELLRSVPELDWKWTVRVSRDLGCGRILSLGLVLAKELLDTPIPDRIIDRAGADASVEALASRLIMNIRSGHEPGSTESSLTVPDSLILSDRRFPFSLYLCASIAPDDHTLLAQLPRSFRALYYGLRPIRLMARRGLPASRKTALVNWLHPFR
jgi:hypothetical protein